MSAHTLSEDFEQEIDAGKTEQAFRITRPGQLLFFVFFSQSKLMEAYLYCDGKELKILNTYWNPENLNDEMPDVRGGICLSQYDTTNGFYSIAIWIPFKWENSFEVKLRNASVAAVDMFATIFYDILGTIPIEEPESDIQREPPTDPRM